MYSQGQAAAARRMWPRIGVRWGLVLVLAVAAAVVAVGWLFFAKTEGRDTLADTAKIRVAQASDLTATLTRSGALADSGDVDVILATPTFFRLTNRSQEAANLGADRSLVFVANENVHYGELSHHFSPILRLDGSRQYAPTDVRVLTDAVHHRTSVVAFGDLPADVTDSTHTLELLLPPGSNGNRAVLQWYTPIDYPDSVKNTGALSLGLLVSLAAGLLAAISPCLLQLTAYYLPTLAGVSMDASGAGAVLAVQRRKVMVTAVLFVLGFTIPYTAGGGLMGGMGQTLADKGVLSPTGPVAIGAGIVMILMAVVVAYRARAPLVCRLPLPAAVQRSRRMSFVEPFVSGFAIATGCLACFGGAILGVLLVYTGLFGSAMLGALSMFLFSMAIGIPFLMSAAGLSWILPVAGKVRKAAPAIGLLSAGMMLFFGFTMATGNYHVVSGWLYQHLPLA